MKRIIVSFLIAFLVMSSLVGAEVLPICGDGLCDLKIESYENCPEDCIKEEKLEEADSSNAQIGQSRILPKSLQKNYNDSIFIVPLIIVIIALMLLLILKIKIAGKTLKEYLWPIKYYILGSILIVISQYTIGLNYNIPYFLNLTQALWALMIIFSLIKLIKFYKEFNILNIIVLGILYSIIIHGLKVSIRYFFYFKPVWYLVDRFLYGSILVMIIVLIAGLISIFLKKKRIKL